LDIFRWGIPEGCQKVAGGRRAAETPGRRSKVFLHPGGMPETTARKELLDTPTREPRTGTPPAPRRGATWVAQVQKYIRVLARLIPMDSKRSWIRSCAILALIRERFQSVGEKTRPVAASRYLRSSASICGKKPLSTAPAPPSVPVARKGRALLGVGTGSTRRRGLIPQEPAFI